MYEGLAKELATSISEQQVENEYFLHFADQIHDIELSTGFNVSIVGAQRMYVLAHFLAAQRISDEKKFLRRMQMQAELDAACGRAAEVVDPGRRMTEYEQFSAAALLCSEYMLRRHSFRAQEFEKRKADMKMLAQRQAEGPSVNSSSEEEGAPAAQHSATDPVPVREAGELHGDDYDADMDTRHELAIAQWRTTEAKKAYNGRKSAAALQEKAAELDGELKTINDAYYVKFAEWQATVVKARRQKKAEKRAAYEERNRRDRLRQAGHVVPPKPLDPAQLAHEYNPYHEASKYTDSHDDEPLPVEEVVPKRVPPGGKLVSKDKRVKN